MGESISARLKRAVPQAVKKPVRGFKFYGLDSLWYRRLMKLIPDLKNYKLSQIDYYRTIATQQGFNSLREYVRFIENNAEELERLRTRLTYPGSHFFRGFDWQLFDEQCLSQLADKEQVRVWCAGCSSGEEVYSVIMCLLDHVPRNRIDVLATDYNEELLGRCRSARYPNRHLPEIPEAFRRYLVRDEQEFAIVEELRGIVKTQPLNLLTDEYPAGFDVIICRNVIKFFSPDARIRVKEGLARALNPKGFLFLSRDDKNDSEMIADPAKLGLRQIEESSIYQRID